MKEKVLVRHLLTHSAGLPSFLPLYKEAKGYEAILRLIYAIPLEAEPGTRTRYSDLGMILTGEIVSRAGGQPLDALVSQRLFQPLGLASTMYRPPASLRRRIAPTEDDPWRKRVVRGEVHDENAFAMGGVAGHAGLFGSAHDLAILAQMLLNRGLYDHRRHLAAATLAQFCAVQGPADSGRGIGWGKPSAASWTGRVFSPSSFGHTGFTGTFVWIDPEKDLFIVLLSNRVHPSRRNALFEEARQSISEAIVKAIAGETSNAAP
jgi:CubicO group peptidase (beta-lactamase class C family)